MADTRQGLKQVWKLPVHMTSPNAFQPTIPPTMGEAEDIIRRMERYDQMDGKRRVCTALELYYEQAGKKLNNEPGKNFQALWDQLVASAQEGNNLPHASIIIRLLEEMSDRWRLDTVATAVQDAITNSKRYERPIEWAQLRVDSKLWEARCALYAIEKWDLGLENQGIKKYEPDQCYYKLPRCRMQYPEEEDLEVYQPLILHRNGTI